MNITNSNFLLMLKECEQQGINGLLFQHIVLCPTRTWLHYHRIDCAHLNRHMQAGIFLHETAYGGVAAHHFGFGIAPDMLDFKKHEISEIKNSKSHESATISQLLFYMLVIQQATQEVWIGKLRYPNSRRTKRIELDKQAKKKLLTTFEQIRTIIVEPQPPKKISKPICKHCSYRLLCWFESTEDRDY